MTRDTTRLSTGRRGFLAGAGAAITAATAGCASIADSDVETPDAYTTPAAAAFDGVVDSQWLTDNLDDVTLLDIRDQEKFETARIPGSHHFSNENMLRSHAEETDNGFEASPDAIAWLLENAGIAPDDDVVVYGAESNLWETYAIYTLRAIGHEGRVSLLDGGYSVWTEGDGETVSSAPEASSATYDPTLDTDVIATRSYVADHVDEGGASIPILDMRSPDEYHGIDQRDGTERWGHITGSINVNFPQSIDNEAGRLRSPEELEQLWIDDVGLSAGEPAIAYCQTAIRASVGWFVLDQLDWDDVRNYEGSWSDWGNLTNDDGYYYTTGDGTGTVIDTFAE